MASAPFVIRVVCRPVATSFEDDGGYLHVQAVDLAVNFAQHVTQKVCEYSSLAFGSFELGPLNFANKVK